MTENKKLTGMQKLQYIQKELKAPKGQFNSFGNYKYRSCEDIMEAVKPLLDKYNTALVMSDAITQVADRIYITATAQLFDSETGELIINVCASAREPMAKKGMDDSQVSGTASSYARKYCLNGLFCIDDAKDADTDEYAKQTRKNVAKSVSEYLQDIDNAETEQEINNLFYEWSKVYVKGTDDYKTLTNKSFERKKQIVGA